MSLALLTERIHFTVAWTIRFVFILMTKTLKIQHHWHAYKCVVSACVKIIFPSVWTKVCMAVHFENCIWEKCILAISSSVWRTSTKPVLTGQIFTTMVPKRVHLHPLLAISGTHNVISDVITAPATGWGFPPKAILAGLTMRIYEIIVYLWIVCKV